MKTLMLGNEAVARGLYEGGCAFVSSYPGTPSTEITEAIAKYPEDMEQIMEGMPSCVGICFDVNHANERWAEIPQWIARLGKYIRTFHISDCDEYDECHWMPGVGVLDWEGIMREIRKLDRDILLIYEINRICYGSSKREVEPRFFFRAIKENTNWLGSLGK